MTTNQQKKQKIIKRIKIGVILSLIAGLLVWANINRLQNNTFANYEKAIDYGRVHEDIETIKPVICALFYTNNETPDGQLSTYLDHTRNYHRRTVKMIVVPKFLTADSFEVVEKLYKEIHRHNTLHDVALVYDGEGDIEQHKMMLQDVMGIDSIKAWLMTENNVQAEKDIETYLQTPGFLVVFLADLDKGIAEENSDFLTQEAIYLSGKHYYRLNVFDAIDTQLAKALEKDYTALFALSADKQKSDARQQKYNLEKYAAKYGSLIWQYFLQNIAAAEQGADPIWPPKNDETYRLYDRATLYIKAQTFEKQIQGKSVAAALIKLAHRVVDRQNSAEQSQIYLLTETEPVQDVKRDLEADDGLYLQYKNYKAALLPEQRENIDDAPQALQHKAGIPTDILPQKIMYYKFKTVEIINEN